MKKSFLLLIISLISYSVNAQNNNPENEKNNEIRLNLISPLSGAVDVGFERHLNKNSSLGISAFIVYDDKKEEDLNYYISPYYRYYFGKKYASGFFLEGFGALTSIDGKKVYTADHLTFTENKDVYDVALGLGLGYKFVTKKGLVFEANAGYGKLLFNAKKTDHDVIAKYGLSIGYRF